MSPTEPPVDGQEVSQSTGGTRVGKDRVDSHNSISSEKAAVDDVPPFYGEGPKKPKSLPYSTKQWTMDEPPRGRGKWNRRPMSPGLQWYKHYDTPESMKTGRVLVIDYVKKDQSKEGMRKVVAQEITSVKGLHKLYDNPERCNSAILRVIHVQCADWALPFLLKKFNLNSRDELVGTDFGRYVKYKRPERRGGKAFLSGKSYKTTHDPWRQISRTSFGLDYLKHYACEKDPSKRKRDTTDKLMELNYYDEQDNPRYGYDVYVQRTSCYIQHVDTGQDVSDPLRFGNPYSTDSSAPGNQRYVPQVDKLDNSNAIIIFENSQSSSIADTLIAARGTWEARWRRLPFYLAYEGGDISNDSEMALECSKIVLQDIWKAVSENWESLLDACDSHISILEDRIYEQPADESRAPELWTNSSMWLKVERLVAVHVAIVREMQTNLREMSGDDGWLEATPDDMEKVTSLVQDDLVKPTDSLSDLMYKSVEIRDSRHSLTLNLSMWRLSWITFVFLPLTFISSFFGMNVDTFKDDPSLKWYFASAVPMMFLVLIMYFIFKNYFAVERQTPYQRGIWEDSFHQLATSYPRLWSRLGPRDDIHPKTPLGRLKWHLILRWNRPEKTIRMGKEDAEWDDLGAWSQFKRRMTRRWTAQLQGNSTSGEADEGPYSSEIGSTSTLQGQAPPYESADNRVEKILFSGGSTDDRTAAGTTAASSGIAGAAAESLPPGLLEVPIPQPQIQALSPPQSRQSDVIQLQQRRRRRRGSGSASGGDSARPSSQGSSGGRNSGILVEEEGPDWLRRWSAGLQGRGRMRDRSGGESGGGDGPAAAAAAAAAGAGGNGTGTGSGDGGSGERAG